jgi:hypothetical protein
MAHGRRAFALIENLESKACRLYGGTRTIPTPFFLQGSG